MTKLATPSICTFRTARFYSSQSATTRATVAISACLAGEKVRYDGADKLFPLYPLLDAELHLVAICPELGAGLGVPRPPVQLIESDGRIRALGRNNSNLDVTAALQNFATQSLPQLLSTHQLCGYLWKSRSPSCGFTSTPIYNTSGVEIDRASGIQAAHFQQHAPHLNYREETELQSKNAAINFILRCRLVFDVIYASAASTTTLHRHYTFLHENFDNCIAENLSALSVTDCKPDYLATLLLGCRQMSEDKLLGLFME